MPLQILAENETCRSGLTVITTASPRNFDFVKSLGADHVFDYVGLIYPLHALSRLANPENSTTQKSASRSML